jgi:3',5'-cyclic-AMP phosphodiesterase
MQYPDLTTATVSSSADVVRVVQLTDCHLCAQPGGTLLSLDTDFSLQAVINQLKARYPNPDLVLGTGDLSDGGARAAYQRLQGYFGQLSEHCFYLPGNHDNHREMIDVLGDYPAMAGTVRAANWQIVMLNSQVPGEVGGCLGAAEIKRLVQALDRGREEGLYSLICMHHQPVPVGSQWIDEQMVSDAASLFSTLEGYDGARGVLWGHVHQQIDWQRGSLPLMATPSTCVQFAPGSENFRADDLAPGYRLLELHPDGTISTTVERVEGIEFTVDLESGGYL